MLMCHHEGNQNILDEQRSISMSSVAQAERAMQTIFRQVNTSVRQTDFVQTLVTAWLTDPQATRGALAQIAASLGVSITPQGLRKRFTKSAATFLQEILDVLVSQIIAADPVAIRILQRFTAHRMRKELTASW